jgi:hypothetical protein
MTREEFIEILDREGYSYKISSNDKLVITSRGKRGINLVGSIIDDTANGGQMVIIIDEIPSGIIFQGNGGVNLSSLEVLPPDVEFRNIGEVDLSSMKLPTDLADSFNNSGDIIFSNLYWKGNWRGNIEGIDNKRLFRLMVKQEAFK